MYAASFAPTSMSAPSCPPPPPPTRRRRVVDGDAVALPGTQGAERRRDPLRPAQRLRGGVRPRLAALVLGDQRSGVAAPGLDVVVDAVVGEIGAPTQIPAERRRLPVEDAVPLLGPPQLLGSAAPEAFGIVGRRSAPRGHRRERVPCRHAPIIRFGGGRSGGPARARRRPRPRRPAAHPPAPGAAPSRRVDRPWHPSPASRS